MQFQGKLLNILEDASKDKAAIEASVNDLMQDLLVDDMRRTEMKSLLKRMKSATARRMGK